MASFTNEDTSCMSLNANRLQLVSDLSESKSQQSVFDDKYSFECYIADDIDLDSNATEQYKINVTPIIIPSDLSCSWYSDCEETSPSFTASDSISISPDDNAPVTCSINGIKFNTICDSYAIASNINGFSSGAHDWTIKVIKSDTCYQEIGIVANIQQFENETKSNTICNNSEFAARASYGNHMDGTCFYASYNMNDSCRCNKYLSSFSSWNDGDEIRVHLDLDKGSITFYLNNKRVRKSLSVQTNVVYFPIMSFSGVGKYKSLDYDCSTF